MGQDWKMSALLQNYVAGLYSGTIEWLCSVATLVTGLPVLLCNSSISAGIHVVLRPPAKQSMESQIGDIYKDMGDLGGLQGGVMSQRGGGATDSGEQSGVVETRIVRLIEPLKERRRILLASKEMHQVAQDLEDEMVRTAAKS